MWVSSNVWSTVPNWSNIILAAETRYQECLTCLTVRDTVFSEFRDFNQMKSFRFNVARYNVCEIDKICILRFHSQEQMHVK